MMLIFSMDPFFDITSKDYNVCAVPRLSSYKRKKMVRNDQTDLYRYSSKVHASEFEGVHDQMSVSERDMIIVRSAPFVYYRLK
jgi:hypothetical protein